MRVHVVGLGLRGQACVEADRRQYEKGKTSHDLAPPGVRPLRTATNMLATSLPPVATLQRLPHPPRVWIMLLIGMFDSPYVRRVAISMKRLGLPFEHGNWSVGADFERIRQYSPLGRVPVLVMDDGVVLVESSAILDAVDDLVGPARGLLPPAGAARPRGGRPGSAARLAAAADGGAPARGLLPPAGASRREALRLISLAIGAGEKARDVVHER